MKRKIILFLPLLALLNISAFAQKAQVGKASFYADAFNHRKTASGERFCMDSFTCAHNLYPFGTWLRVTNLKNNKSVVVRVNDRGPFRPPRVIDLSKAAAKKIDMYTAGVATVRIEKISRPDEPEVADPEDLIADNTKKDDPSKDKPDTNYGIQAGAFRDKSNLANRIESLKAFGYTNTSAVPLEKDGEVVYKLIVGPYNTHSAAEQTLNYFKSKNIDCILVKL